MKACTRSACLALVMTSLLSGCASVGPGRLAQDRTDYNASLTESWKRQILMNIVKIRYVEPVFFMDVGDIVAGYTMETAGNAGFSRTMYDAPTPITDNNNPVLGNFGRLEFGVSGRFTDRPTITYRPMTGAPFRKGVMSPLPLRSVMTGLDSGISAQFLFSLGVRSVNGLRNAHAGLHGQMTGQNGFMRVGEILGQLQMFNAVRVTIEQPRQGGEGRILLTLGGRHSPPEVEPLIRELRTLLDLDPAVREYEVVGLPEPQNRGQIALQTYSLLQIMASVAARVDVPEGDIASKCAMPAPPDAPGEGVIERSAVRSSREKPTSAFVAVSFHGHWFWVDDHDLATKRVFSFLMLAFTLMEDKTGSPPVQLTIPVN